MLSANRPMYAEALLIAVLFSIFLILMLPFAGPFLSRKVRAWFGSRNVKIILAMQLIIVPALFAGLVFTVSEPIWMRFSERILWNYRKLTDACDSVLADHPLGTNVEIEISATDPSLPNIIKRLNPVAIRVKPHGLWMMLEHPSRAGYAVEWGQDPDNTNIWALSAGGEGVFDTVYTSAPPVLSRN